MPVYKIYKNLGETPLQSLERTRIEKEIGADISMTYAGRLDPAAEGEMYIITGDDISNKDDYLASDKIYEVEYILGASTDTGDLLGILKNHISKDLVIDTKEIKESLKSLVGERQQAFHKFSSKTVAGKPLWLHAREGTEAKATHSVNIKRLELVSSGFISTQDIFNRVDMLCRIVQGDFRQDAIIRSWENFSKLELTLPIIKIYANVSTGTYMRVLGEEIGDLLQIPVCAYSIIRKEIIN